MRAIFILFIICLFSSVCFSESIAAINEEVYERNHPYYVEVCTVSRSKKKTDIDYDIYPGHSIFYIHGVCRDMSKDYPYVGNCENLKNNRYRHKGVGLSVNNASKNITWNAFPGKKLFFNGLVKDKQRLTEDLIQRKLNYSIEKLKLFDGIEVHREYLANKPIGMSVKEHYARLNLGIDFAVNYGRSVYCSRIPIKKNMIDPLVVYLNNVNKPFLNREKNYHWNLLANNCSHFIHNTLAHIGIVEKQRTNAGAKQLFNLSVPANEVINFSKLTVDKPIFHKKLLKDKVRSDIFQKERWIPTRHGAIVKIYPQHKNNDVFYKDKLMEVVEFFPFPMPSSILPKKLQKNKRKFMSIIAPNTPYTSLEKNYEFYEKKYKKALDKAHFQNDASSEYLSYISRQLEEVKQFKQRLLTINK